MLNWKIVEENYLEYLRKIEKRIPFSDYGQDKHKPFFGVLFQKNEIAYITQISHPQARHLDMKNSLDFQRVYHPLDNRLIAIINLNYMFPIHISLLKDLEYRDIELYRTFKNELEKSKYIDLLKKELEVINKLNLKDKAIKVYDLKKSYPEHTVSKRCFNFKDLEKYALQYFKQDLYLTPEEELIMWDRINSEERISSDEVRKILL